MLIYNANGTVVSNGWDVGKSDLPVMHGKPLFLVF